MQGQCNLYLNTLQGHQQAGCVGACATLHVCVFASLRMCTHGRGCTQACSSHGRSHIGHGQLQGTFALRQETEHSCAPPPPHCTAHVKGLPLDHKQVASLNVPVAVLFPKDVFHFLQAQRIEYGGKRNDVLQKQMVLCHPLGTVPLTHATGQFSPPAPSQPQPSPSRGPKCWGGCRCKDCI